MDSEIDPDPKADASNDDDSTDSCCCITVRTHMRACWILVVLTQTVQWTFGMPGSVLQWFVLNPVFFSKICVSP